MKTVVFLKGSDIDIFADDNLLSGVISLKIKENRELYNICEYLSGEYVQQVPLKRKFELTLEKAFTEEDVLENLTDFTIKVKAGNKEAVYEGCSLTEKNHNLSGQKPLSTVYKITALSKTENEVQNGNN